MRNILFIFYNDGAGNLVQTKGLNYTTFIMTNMVIKM